MFRNEIFFWAQAIKIATGLTFKFCAAVEYYDLQFFLPLEYQKIYIYQLYAMYYLL